MKHTKNDLARIVLAIQETLAGKEWDSDTCSDVADILDRNGFEIAEPNEED